MSVISNRSIVISFDQDIEFSQIFDASPNPSGSGEITNMVLNTGDNTIPVPINSVAVTIIPPSSNLNTLTLKGNNSDTGIQLNLTDPTSIGLKTSSPFVLNASAPTTIRLIFS